VSEVETKAAIKDQGDSRKGTDSVANGVSITLLRVIERLKTNGYAHMAWAAFGIMLMLHLHLLYAHKLSYNVVQEEKLAREKLLVSLIKRIDASQLEDWMEAFRLVTRTQCAGWIQEARQEAQEAAKAAQ
jgi:hypothetical protein